MSTLVQWLVGGGNENGPTRKESAIVDKIHVLRVRLRTAGIRLNNDHSHGAGSGVRLVVEPPPLPTQ